MDNRCQTCNKQDKTVQVYDITTTFPHSLIVLCEACANTDTSAPNTSASKKEDVQKKKALEEYIKAATEQFLNEMEALRKLNSRF